MARRKSNIVRVKKTMHVLPETATFIENMASSKGIFEASVIDEAIALMREVKDANLSSVA